MSNWGVTSWFLFSFSASNRSLRYLLQQIVIMWFSRAIKGNQKLILVVLCLQIGSGVNLFEYLVYSILFNLDLLDILPQFWFLYWFSLTKFSTQLIDNKYIYSFVVFMNKIMNLSPTAFRTMWRFFSDTRFRSAYFLGFVIKCHKLFSVAIITIGFIKVCKFLK